MPVALRIHQHVRSDNLLHGFWLPFLYQTQSIVRPTGSFRTTGSALVRPQRCAYASGIEALESASRPLPRGRHAQSGRRPTSRSQDDGPRSRSGRTPRSQDEGSRVESERGSGGIYQPLVISSDESPSFSQETESRRSGEKSWLSEGYTPVLPFENLKPIFGKGRVTQGNSLTGSEARAFQALMAMRKISPPVNQKADQDSNEPDLSTVISKAIGVDIPYSESAKLVAEYAGRQQDQDTMAVGPLEEEQETKVGGILRKTRSLMTDAQTDLRLWEILHERVINDVKALNLDSRDEASQQNRRTTLAQDTEILSVTFPRTLVIFHKVLQSSFPTSAYGLAVLPYLQQLGPSTFALGATTELYNQHLRLLYEQRLDIRSMVVLLDEMHQKVFEFDAETRSIVQAVLRRARQVEEKPYLKAHKVFWSTKIMQQNLASLQRREEIIMQGISEVALRQARSERVSTASPGYMQKYGLGEASL